MRIQEVWRAVRVVFLENLFQNIINKLVSLHNLLEAQRHTQEKGGFIYMEYKL